MSEVEKMYKNANAEDKNINSQLYRDLNYPQFTAEKQLKVLDALLNYNKDRTINIWKDDSDFIISVTDIGTDMIYDSTGRCFSVALAETVNNLWQDLTEKERKQIREMLE